MKAIIENDAVKVSGAGLFAELGRIVGEAAKANADKEHMISNIVGA